MDHHVDELDPRPLDQDADDDAFNDLEDETVRSCGAVLPPPMSLSRSGATPFSGQMDVNNIMPSTSEHTSVTKDLEFNPTQDHTRSLDVVPNMFHMQHLDNPEILPHERRSAHESDVNVEEFRTLDLPQDYTLAPFSHFPTNTTREASLRALHYFFKAHQIEYNSLPKICKWECCCASNASEVDFEVRLWSRPTSMTIEFTMQYGDQRKFFHLFNACKAIFTGSQVPSKPHAFAPMPLESSRKRMEGVESLVARLLDMLSSHLPDSALEASRALVQLSTEKDLRLELHRLDVIPALVALLQIQNDSLHDHTWFSCRHFVVVCLANLSEEPMIQGSLFEAAEMLVDLVGEGSYQDRAMRREATRALRNLAQDSRGADGIIKRVGKARLESLCQSVYPNLVDIQMQNDVAEIKSSLERRWASVA